MRVDVDDAGGEREAARVHALAGGAEIVTDGGDASAGHRHPARARRAAEAVEDDGVVDHQVVHLSPMGAPNGPPTPKRSELPGEAVALLDVRVSRA